MERVSGRDGMVDIADLKSAKKPDISTRPVGKTPRTYGKQSVNVGSLHSGITHRSGPPLVRLRQAQTDRLKIQMMDDTTKARPQ